MKKKKASAEPKSSMIRVLIADDHPVVRRGLVSMADYEPDMSVVGEAKNGQEVVDLFRLHQPDVTLLDLRMPGMDGVEAMQRLREEFPDARFILLTTYDNDEAIYQGLRAGARAYLLKDLPTEVLLEAIRAVHSGQKRIPQEIAAKLTDRMGRSELSEREMGVLRHLVMGKSNAEIGAELFIAETTVKYHVNNLFVKLEVTDRTQAVTVALHRGLVLLK